MQEVRSERLSAKECRDRHLASIWTTDDFTIQRHLWRAAKVHNTTMRREAAKLASMLCGGSDGSPARAQDDDAGTARSLG
jgi:hypothetical protein